MSGSWQRIFAKHYLSLYNDGKEGVATPNVEKLAAEGIVFNNAYCNAPVSSAARSTLITGCYAPSFGSQLSSETSKDAHA